MRDAFVRRLTSIAEADPRVMLVVGDLGFGVVTDFAARFPKQFINAGVAEQNMTGVATGLALSGRIVFTYSIANFPTLRCLEQIRNDASYHGANVKVVGIGGGFSYGALGMSHHATEDLAVLRAIPDTTVVAPGDDWEAAEATSALASTPGTAYLRLDRSSAASEPRAGESFTVGRARVVRRGDDVTIIATGGVLSEVQRAADDLASTGIEPRVLSMHTIKPIDRESIRAACEETTAVVTVEEHVAEGGLSSAVAEVFLDLGTWPRRFARICVTGGFASVVGDQTYLRHRYGLDAPAIAHRVRSLLESRAVGDPS